MSTATTTAPRKLHQVLVWLIAAIALVGVGFLASGGATSGTGTDAFTSAASTTSTSTVAQPTTASQPVEFYAGPQLEVPEEEGGEPGQCEAGNADDSYLPALRWTDFGLSAWDDAFLFKFTSMMTSVSSFFFFIGDLFWKILFFLTNFGVTFHPLCSTAGTVNSLVADIGTLGAFALVPAFAYWFFTARKDIINQKWAPVISGFLTFAFLFGAVFYLVNTAKDADSEVGSDNNAILDYEGTVPWMANKVMGGAATMSSSIASITNLLGSDDGSTDMTAFKDNDANAFSCASFVNGVGGNDGLYNIYTASAEREGISGPQTGMLTQLSRIWELGYLATWQRAQFGADHDEDTYPFASRASCRMLESTVDASNSAKSNAFSKAHGFGEGEAAGIIPSGLIWMMQPLGDTYKLPNAMAWASCVYSTENGWSLAEGVEDANQSDTLMCGKNSDRGMAQGKTLTDMQDADVKMEDIVWELGAGGTDNLYYLEAGEDDIEKAIGYAEGEGIGAYRDFARASIGQNAATAMAQSLLAAAVSGVYAWSFGPMAVGLVIVGFALLILLTLLPVTVVLIALKIKAGLKLLKLTGTSLFVMLIFGLVLSFLTMIISLFTSIVTGIAGGGNGWFTQIVLAAVPIAAVLLLKKFATMMGMANIGSLSGSLGFMAGMASKAAGGSGGGVSSALSGAGGRGKGALGKGARGLGAAANALRKGDGPSPLQKLAQSRLGRSALGQKALGKMQQGADKVKKATSDAGAIAKDGALRAADSLAGSRPGQAAKKLADKTSQLARSQNGQVAKRLVGSGALAGAGVLAGALSPAAIPAIMAASAAAPVGRAVTKAIKDRNGKEERKLEGIVDDEGNVLQTPEALAAARKKGTMSRADAAHRRLAQRAMRNMDPEQLKQFNHAYEDGQTAGMPTSKAHKEAQKNAIAARREISQIQDPALRKAMLEEYAGNHLDKVRARQHGGNSPDGMNTAFNGFHGATDQLRAQQEIAAKLGVRPEDITLGTHGISVPAAALGENRQKNGAPLLPEDASLQLASNPALYLDDETRRRGVNETDDQYAARITAALGARGMIDDQGNVVDVFKARGIDVDTEAGAARAQAWLNGKSDVALDGISITPVDGEQRLLAAASRWTDAHSIDYARTQMSTAAEHVEAREQTITRVRDIESIPVAGAIAPVAESTQKVRAELDTSNLQASNMRLEPATLQVNGADAAVLSSYKPTVEGHQVVAVETAFEDPQTGEMAGHGIRMAEVDAKGVPVNLSAGETVVRAIPPAEVTEVLSAQKGTITVAGAEAVVTAIEPRVPGNQVVQVETVARGADGSSSAPTPRIIEVDASGVPVNLPEGEVIVKGTANHRPALAEIPVALPAATVAGGSVKVDSSNIPEVEFKAITLKDVSESMADRSERMVSQINSIVADPSDKNLREAARSLGGVEDFRREITQMLDGLELSTKSRADLAVEHYAAMNPMEVTSSQIQQKAKESFIRAEKEVAERSTIFNGMFSDLFRSTHVAQHSANDEERRQALRDAAQQMADIRKTAQALYEEEQQAAEEIAELTDKAVREAEELMKAKNNTYQSPSRGVVKSTTLLDEHAPEMARLKETLSGANA